ncbi:MAG: hypothetical protein AB3N16_04245, partial [Flavobacteriaceae bacterium]
NVKQYAFKKGEILDILLLSKRASTDSLFKNYRKTVFPIGQEYGYEGMPSWPVSEPALQGNYQPEFLIIAKWKNITLRKGFLQNIERVVPDFHEQRRQIWPTFHLTYYKIKKDLLFSINGNRYNVVSAFWYDKDTKGKKFAKQWIADAKVSGAGIQLVLAGGTSPFGYHYGADSFIITSWKDKKAFLNFQKSYDGRYEGQVAHINQFSLSQ